MPRFGIITSVEERTNRFNTWGECAMPVNPMTSLAPYDYSPIKALKGFSVALKCEFKVDSADPCKIIGDPVVTFTVTDSAPLWDIVSGPTNNHWMTEADKADCTSSKGHLNKMDQVHCQGNVTMSLKTPGIPTPWGSAGSITLATVQVQIDLFASSDGSTSIEKTVDGQKV
jgi:hypothetical protein